ncbi:hypothetical protein [Lacrimispora sp.]|uniref:hypothetical protein n=1 Tax=Lacrimispora sp. TaxID=2719234 RepID=UPI002855DF8F|nr:hypothetical protein [Lacrimispora sp.]MDR7814653.1 hypothetical protein [Lacrimispora sp.]
MKIDYTDYCNRNLEIETDKTKIEKMNTLLKTALIEHGIKGKISATYYTDGNIKVEVDGKYYNMFNSVKNKFFSGNVGEYDN